MESILTDTLITITTNSSTTLIIWSKIIELVVSGLITLFVAWFIWWLQRRHYQSADRKECLSALELALLDIHSFIENIIPVSLVIYRGMGVSKYAQYVKTFQTDGLEKILQIYWKGGNLIDFVLLHDLKGVVKVINDVSNIAKDYQLSLELPQPHKGPKQTQCKDRLIGSSINIRSTIKTYNRISKLVTSKRSDGLPIIPEERPQIIFNELRATTFQDSINPYWLVNELDSFNKIIGYGLTDQDRE